jgi:hypothetical protein
MAAQLLSRLPARRDYKPEVVPASHDALPFINRPKRKSKRNPHTNWHVPPANDYGEACQMGEEYAAHYVQYLKDNPFWVGSNMLGLIAGDIDFKDDTAAKGYWVGFFTYLERLIHAQSTRMDVFADVDQRHAKYAEFVAWCEAEAAEEAKEA